jgi:hypothetical protein
MKEPVFLDLSLLDDHRADGDDFVPLVMVEARRFQIHDRKSHFIERDRRGKRSVGVTDRFPDFLAQIVVQEVPLVSYHGILARSVSNFDRHGHHPFSESCERNTHKIRKLLVEAALWRKKRHGAIVGMH